MMPAGKISLKSTPTTLKDMLADTLSLYDETAQKN
jgi:hypothetical protein